MKKHINLVLIFATIAALVVAAVEYKRLHTAVKTNNDAAAAISKRNATMKTRIDDLKSTASQLADASGDVTNADVSAMLAAKVKADKESSERWQASDTARVKWLAERMKNDSDFAFKRYAYIKAKVAMMDAPFCRVQHLSKEQSEALADAEFKRMMKIDDMHIAQQINESDVDAKTATKEADDEFASNAKAILGDDLYEQFLVYQRQGAAWDYVNAYGGTVALADMPLNVEQLSQLGEAIANACPAFQDGKNVDLETVDWNAVDAAAVNFLTPEQMNFFKNVIGVSGVDPVRSVGGSRQFHEFSSTARKLAQ